MTASRKASISGWYPASEGRPGFYTNASDPYERRPLSEEDCLERFVLAARPGVIDLRHVIVTVSKGGLAIGYYPQHPNPTTSKE